MGNKYFALYDHSDRLSRHLRYITGCCVCQQAAEGGNLEAGHLSDATASGPASDDEASSMAATVGSILHTSPADREGSGAGSDSGGSQVDSVSGMLHLLHR